MRGGFFARGFEGFEAGVVWVDEAVEVDGAAWGGRVFGYFEGFVESTWGGRVSERGGVGEGGRGAHLKTGLEPAV